MGINRLFTGAGSRRSRAVALAATLFAAAFVLAAPHAGAATAPTAPAGDPYASALANPTANLPSPRTAPCPWRRVPVSPTMAYLYEQYDPTAACALPYLVAIDQAHADEGAAPMVLPSNWFSLTPAEQIFVATNLERVDRGLSPIPALTTQLDQDAQTGAQRGTDPILSVAQYESWGCTISSVSAKTTWFSCPPSMPAYSYGSVWDGGNSDVLGAIFGWMYNDGWGGPTHTDNRDCTSPTATGCWGHRDNLIGHWGCGADQCFAGAALTPQGWSGNPSYAEIVFNSNGGMLPGDHAVFTWAGEQPYLVGTPLAALPVLPAGVRAVGVVADPRCSSCGWVVSSDGGVYTFGSAGFYGSLGATPPASPIVGVAAAPTGGGYWLVGANGAVYGFGAARYYGSMAGRHLAAPVVGMAATPTGGGYWLVASDGGIFTFGNARFYGSMGGHHLDKPVVGMAATPTGGGYWEVAADGGIFTFGNARFYGSTGGIALDAPISSMQAMPTGGGYRLVARDGGVFDFGDAPFPGSMADELKPATVVGSALGPGAQELLVLADGAAFGLGG